MSPQASHEAVERHLAALDRAAPGLVAAYYVTGSTALGDYRPAQSDVDFIAVVTRDLEDADLDILDEVHRSIAAKPHMDGAYLTAERFAARPRRGEAVPFTLDGVLHRDDGCFQLNPVTWAELAQCGIVARGETPLFEVDVDELRAFNRGNLTSYWLPFVAEVRAKVAGREPDAPLPYPDTLTWLVAGPPRLHFTIANGEITSKTTAARYAAALFPAWERLVEKALAVRDGRVEVVPTVADLADAADLAEAVAYDALSNGTRFA